MHAFESADATTPTATSYRALHIANAALFAGLRVARRIDAVEQVPAGRAAQQS
jgi:hypothetical protein